jgi:hypothetical protein
MIMIVVTPVESKGSEGNSRSSAMESSRAGKRPGPVRTDLKRTRADFETRIDCVSSLQKTGNRAADDVVQTKKDGGRIVVS